MGFSTLVIAGSVSVCSGLALAVCLRELGREWGAVTGRRFVKELHRHRNVYLDSADGRMFTVENDAFEKLIERRVQRMTAQEGSAPLLDRTTYVGIVSVLAFVSLAAFCAGVSHLL